MGRIHPPSHFQAKYAVDSVRYVDELGELLKEAPEVRRRVRSPPVCMRPERIRHRTHARLRWSCGAQSLSLLSLRCRRSVVVVRNVLMEWVLVGVLVVTPLRRQVHVLHGQNTDSQSWAKFTLPKEAEGCVEEERWRKELLLPTMREARVVKSAAEIDVLRYVARISSQGHVRVMQSVKPGMAEYQLEATFQV